VILADANLLIYAKVESFPQHDAARAWLEERLNGHARVGLPWPSLLAFVRLVTNPRVFKNPMQTKEAWQQVQEWLGLPKTWIPTPTVRHPEILGRLLTSINATGNLVPDAHLAALSVEHGLVVCSSDSDFARFPDVRWENPLSAR
jgi:uncharacterized protein